MDENQFWITIWKIVAAVVVTLILTVGGCTVNQQFKIAELVAGGADPLKAQCAIYGAGNTSNATICGVMATK